MVEKESDVNMWPWWDISGDAQALGVRAALWLHSENRHPPEDWINRMAIHWITGLERKYLDV